jgi:DNA-binding transcriptional LysR family regulator
MELRHLRYFLAVAEELHFGKAAKRLHISQPPLSQQIRVLEEEMGVSLFDRTRRRVELSEAGKAFLPEAKSALLKAESAVSIAQRAARGEVGDLRIGYSGSATFHPRISRILGRFRSSYPSIRLIVSDIPTRAQEKALIEGTLDIGIVRPPLEHGVSELQLMVIAQEPMCVALPSEHPLATRERLSLTDLVGEPFVLYHRSENRSTFDRIMAACEKAGFAPRVAQEAPHFASIVGMVAAGLGVALVPDSVSKLAAEGVEYRPISRPAPMIALGVAWLAGNKLQVVRSFEKTVSEFLEAEPAEV